MPPTSPFLAASAGTPGHDVAQRDILRHKALADNYFPLPADALPVAGGTIALARERLIVLNQTSEEGRVT